MAEQMLPRNAQERKAQEEAEAAPLPKRGDEVSAGGGGDQAEETGPRTYGVEEVVNPPDDSEITARVDSVMTGEPVNPDAKKQTRAEILQETRDRKKKIEQGYADHTKRRNLWSGEYLNYTDEQREQIMNERHSQFTRLMAMNCIKPLSNGIDTGSIMSVATTAAMMWTFSPQFRDLMWDYNKQMHQGVEERREDMKQYRRDVVDKMKKVPLGSSKAKAAKARREAEEAGVSLDKRQESIDAGKQVHSVDSAALELKLLVDGAYWAAREADPETGELPDPVEINDSLLALVEYRRAGIWADSGLSSSAVHARMRDLVGYEMGTDPGFASTYRELGGGAARLSKQVPIKGADGETRLGWSRRWQMAEGHMANDTKTGPFNVRFPMTRDEHARIMARSMMQDMTLMGQGEGGLDALRESMIGFQSGVDLSGVIPGPDAPGLPADPGYAAVHRSRMFLQSMTDDGYPNEARDATYRQALGMAMEQLGEKHPKMLAELEEKYPIGPEWDTAKEEFVARCHKDGREREILPLISNPRSKGADQMPELLSRSREDLTYPPGRRDEWMEVREVEPEGEWSPRVSETALEVLQEEKEVERQVDQAKEVERQVDQAKEAGTGPVVALDKQGQQEAGGPRPVQSNSAPRPAGESQDKKLPRGPIRPAADGTVNRDESPVDGGRAAAQAYLGGPQVLDEHKGGEQWRKRGQDQAYEDETRPRPSVEGPGANVSQRAQAAGRAARAGKTVAPGARSVDDPSTSYQEQEGESAGVGHSLEHKRVQNMRREDPKVKPRPPAPPKPPSPSGPSFGL